MLYTPLFLLRRLLFIVIVFFLSEYTGLQVIFMMALNLVYVLYIAIVRPFKK